MVITVHLDEVVKDITSLGYMPSFCTACYRSQRTGDRFMELAKSGNIGKICVPNGMATFEEYLNDFASPETKELGKEFIKSELEKLEGTAKRKSEQMIEKVDQGERDIFL